MCARGNRTHFTLFIYIVVPTIKSKQVFCCCFIVFPKTWEIWFFYVTGFYPDDVDEVVKLIDINQHLLLMM